MCTGHNSSDLFTCVRHCTVVSDTFCSDACSGYAPSNWWWWKVGPLHSWHSFI